MDDTSLKQKQEETKAAKPQLSTKVFIWVEGTVNTIRNYGKKAEIEKSAADIQTDEK